MKKRLLVTLRNDLYYTQNRKGDDHGKARGNPAGLFDGWRGGKQNGRYRSHTAIL